MRTRLLLAPAGVAALTACSSGSSGDRTPRAESTVPSAPAPASAGASASSAAPPGEPDLSKPQTVVSGLEVPWGLAFLPDVSALVSERDKGDILKIPVGGGEPQKVYQMPGVDSGGEGGLL